MRMRTLIVGVAVVAMLGIGATPALAAPIGAKGAVTIQATCDRGLSGLGTVIVVTAGNGNDVWSPAISTNRNLHLVLVPYNFHIDFTFTPSGGQAIPLPSSDSVKRAPHSGRLSSCTFQFVFPVISGVDGWVDPDGSMTMDFIVLVSYTPVH